MGEYICVGIGTGSPSVLEARRAAILAQAATWGGEEVDCEGNPV